MLWRNGFEVYGETAIWHDSVRLWLHSKQGSRRQIVEPMQAVVKVEDDVPTATPVEPSLELSRATMQNLMTELWRLGYRPVGHDFRSTDGEVRALNEHMQDLRRLVFRLDVEPRS